MTVRLLQILSTFDKGRMSGDMGSFRRVKIVKWAPFGVPSIRYKFITPQISFRGTLNCIILACVVFSCFDTKVATQYVDVVTVTVTVGLSETAI